MLGDISYDKATLKSEGNIKYSLTHTHARTRTHARTHTHTHTYLLTHTHSLTHSLTRSLTRSLAHSLTHSENIVCRAELGRYALSIDIKASICSYWQRLKHSTNNMLLREAFQYATKNTPFFNIQQNEEINTKCKVKEPVTRQHIKNARLVIKKTLRGSIFTELA